jgi:hypothetical protein
MAGIGWRELAPQFCFPARHEGAKQHSVTEEAAFLLRIPAAIVSTWHIRIPTVSMINRMLPALRIFHLGRLPCAALRLEFFPDIKVGSLRKL